MHAEKAAGVTVGVFEARRIAHAAYPAQVLLAAAVGKQVAAGAQAAMHAKDGVAHVAAMSAAAAGTSAEAGAKATARRRSVIFSMVLCGGVWGCGVVE